MRRTHLYLVQEIKYYASQLRDLGFSCTIHWLPSHIENTSAGKRYTGNYYADKLATNGQKQSNEDQERDQIPFVREQILSASIEVINSIDKKLELTDNPLDGPPAVADDFGACTDAGWDLDIETP